MNAITRNTKNNKRGKHLLFLFNGNVFVSLKNTKLLCGYSESTGNDVILSKVSHNNVIKQYNFSQKGNLSESLYINYNGFMELHNRLKQQDKKQNAKLAIEMIQETINELRNVENLTKPSQKISEYQMIDEICHALGKYDETTKHRWVRAYDELDKRLSISIRSEHQKFKTCNSSNISLINYIKIYTSLTPVLYDIVKDMYMNKK